MTHLEVIDLAEKAAVLFRTLVNDGVPIEVAADALCAFLSTVVMNHTLDPRQPWDGQ